MMDVESKLTIHQITFFVRLQVYLVSTDAYSDRIEHANNATFIWTNGNTFFSQKEVVKSIGNPAGIWQGTGLGLRERDRDGIGLGLSRLRATPFTFATISQRRMHESKSQAT